MRFFFLLFFLAPLVVTAQRFTFASLGTKTTISETLEFGHTVSPADGKVRVGLRVRSPAGYVALGPVADGSGGMTDGKGVVIGWGEGAAESVEEYNINGYSASQIVKVAAAQSGVGLRFFERNATAGTIAVLFERPAAATGTEAAVKIGGGTTRFIYASAGTDFISQHSGINGFFEVDLSLKCPSDCSGAAGRCGAGNVCACATGYAGTGCEQCDTGFERDTAGVCVKASTGGGTATEGAVATFAAMSSQAAQAAGGDWEVRWSVDATAGTVRFAVRARTEGWVAIGFDTSSMVSGDTVIGALVGTSTERVRSYTVTGRSSGAIEEDTVQSITDTSAAMDGEFTVFAFTRKLDTGIDGKPVLSADGSFPFVYAFASSDSLTSKHATSQRGSGNLNLGTGSASVSSDDTEAKVIAHGALMFIAWWVCIGIGYISAAYFRHRGPIWFKTHQAMQIGGLVISCIALFIALSMVSTHFRIAHTWFGLLAMILGLLQPINAAFRPAPDAGQKRKVFNIIHIATGSLAILFAWIATGLGLKAADASNAVFGSFYAYVAIFAIVVIYGELKLRPLRNKTK